MIADLRPGQLAAGGQGQLHPDVHRKLVEVVGRVNKSDLPDEVRFLTDTSSFDGDGAGFGDYAGWGLADGSDGRIAVPDLGALKAIVRVG